MDTINTKGSISVAISAFNVSCSITSCDVKTEGKSLSGFRFSWITRPTPIAKANVPGSKHSSSGVYVFQGVGFLFCCKYDLLQYSPTSYCQCFSIFRCVFHFLFSLMYRWRKNWLASHDSFCILNNFIVFEQQTKGRMLDSYSIIQWLLFSL